MIFQQLYFTVPVLTLYGVYVCAFADQFWCVLPVTLPWISWLRRLTRLDWRLSGCVLRAGRPSSHQCPSWLCTTRSATWTGWWHVGKFTLDSKDFDAWLLLCTCTNFITSWPSISGILGILLLYYFVHLHILPVLSLGSQISPHFLTHTLVRIVYSNRGNQIL